MLLLAGKVSTEEQGKQLLLQNIQNGKGLAKFEQLLKQQGGDASIINDYQKLPLSSHKVYFYAPSDGYVQAMDTAAIGRASQETGAGRKQKTDVIDFGAGIVLKKRIGDSVTKGVVIAEIYSSTEKQGQNALSIIENAFEIGKNKISVPPLILDVIQ